MRISVKIRSPRAPSIALGDALERAVKVYQKERRNVAPVDIVAQHMGYTNANNGAAAHAIASLRYFGLLERPKDGHLNVSAEVEQYLLAPSEAQKRHLRRHWMCNPVAFKAIIGRYPKHLPSDATLRVDLIGQGFSPESADGFISVFKKSADFAEVFALEDLEFLDMTFLDMEVGTTRDSPSDIKKQAEQMRLDNDANNFSSAPEIPKPTTSKLNAKIPRKFEPVLENSNWNAAENLSTSDKIPVRLSQGRKAWLVIPSPFYEQDKIRLKAQIDLLLTDEL